MDGVMDAGQIEVVRVEIAKIELKRGDTLVVRVDNSRFDDETRMRMHSQIRKVLPDGVGLIITNEDVSFEMMVYSDDPVAIETRPKGEMLG